MQGAYYGVLKKIKKNSLIKFIYDIKHITRLHFKHRFKKKH